MLQDFVLREVFFGWKVVGAAFVAALFAYGTGLYGPTVFLHAQQITRGWTIATLSAAVTVHFLVSAAAVSFLSEAHRRFGVAVVTRVGTALLCVGLLAWGWAQAPWQLFGAALLTGAGYATMSGAGIIAMVSPWFERMRPIALSHAFNGASLSGVVFVPLWTFLIAKLGLGEATAIVSAAMLFVLWPACRTLSSWPSPHAMGLLPDGAAALGAPPSRSALPVPTGHCSWTVASSRFSASFALGLFAQIGLVTHLDRASGARDRRSAGCGLDQPRYPLRHRGAHVAGHDDGCRGSSRPESITSRRRPAGLRCWPSDTSLPALLAGCVLLGLGVGNLVSLPPLIAQVEFDRADIPRIMGLITAVNQTLLAFAPGVIGALHDAARQLRHSICAAAYNPWPRIVILLRPKHGEARIAMPAGNLLPSVRSSPISNVSRRRRRIAGFAESEKRAIEQRISALDLNLRLARRRDIPAIQEFQAQRFAKGTLLEDGYVLYRTIRFGCAVVVENADGRIVGCNLCQSFDDADRTLWGVRNSADASVSGANLAAEQANYTNLIGMLRGSCFRRGFFAPAISVPHRTCLIMSASSQRLLITTSQGMKDLDLSW